MPYDPAQLDESLQDSYVRDGYVYDLYDGDTVYYHVNLGYNVWGAFQVGRLLDVWAPEIRPLATRADATRAKEQLQYYLKTYALNRDDPESMSRVGSLLRLQSVKGNNKWFRRIPLFDTGKYGRWLVRLWGADNQGRPVDINELMCQFLDAQP